MNTAHKGKGFGISLNRFLLYIGIIAILTFILAPIFIVIATSFNPRHITFPPHGFSLRWFKILLTRSDFMHAAYISLIVATIASVISTFLGVLTSLALTRYRFAGRGLLQLIFMSPLLIPAVIVGLALYHLSFALGMPRSFLILIIGHIVITIPFPVRTIMAVLHDFDRSYEEAAICLGANSCQAFFKITLPLIRPGIIAGALLTFIMSWNEFTTSIFLAGQGTMTLPIRIYTYIQYEFEPVLSAISTILIFLSALAIILIDKFIGLSAFVTGAEFGK